MAEIKVSPDDVRQLASSVEAVGQDVTGLGGELRGFEGAAGAAPPETAASLVNFAYQWSVGLERFGGAVSGFGQASAAAAWLYELVDNQAMPGTP